MFVSAASADRNLSPLTLRAYAGDLRLFARTLGVRDVGAITTDDLRRYVDTLCGLGRYQGTTVRRRLATLKVFFRFLEEERIISDSPAMRLHGRYTVIRRLPRVMSLREVRALLRACRREVVRSKTRQTEPETRLSVDSATFRALRDLAAFELLFATGMRIGELVALSVTDVDFEERSVRILGKGRRERLTFISSDEALEAIRDYVALRTSVPSMVPSLMLNKFGRQLTIYSVENAFGKHCRLARIRGHYTPHCLRHTMATMLLNNGADIRSVQEILGHRTISTTQIYTEVTIGQKRRTMMKFHARNSMHLNPRTAPLLPPQALVQPLTT